MNLSIHTMPNKNVCHFLPFFFYSFRELSRIYSLRMGIQCAIYMKRWRKSSFSIGLYLIVFFRFVSGTFPSSSTTSIRTLSTWWISFSAKKLSRQFLFIFFLYFSSLFLELNVNWKPFEITFIPLSTSWLRRYDGTRSKEKEKRNLMNSIWVSDHGMSITDYAQ